MSSIYEYPDDNNINWSQVTEISQCIYYFIIITIIIIIIIIITTTTFVQSINNYIRT